MRRGASVTIPRRSAMSWLTGGAPSATTVPKVGQRPGQVLFTRSDLEKSSWKADLTIGAYTMFGGI